MTLHAFTVTVQVPDHMDPEDVRAGLVAALVLAVSEMCSHASDREKGEIGVAVEGTDLPVELRGH